MFMKKSTRIALGALMLGGFLLVTLYMLESDQTVIVKPSAPSPFDSNDALPLPKVDQLEKTATKAWKHINDEFFTGSPEPLIIWEDDRSVLYAEANKLYFARFGEKKRQLHEWNENYPSRAWLNGDYVLIGSQRNYDPHVDFERGYWLAVHLNGAHTTSQSIAEQAFPINESFFGPNEVMRVKIVEKPSLYILQVKNGSGFSEMMYSPKVKSWRTIHHDRYEYGGSPTPPAEKAPNQSYEVERFISEEKHELSNGTSFYVFKDSEGMFVYMDQPSPFVARYSDYEFVDVQWLTGTSGDKGYIMAQLHHKTESKWNTMTILNEGSASWLPPDPRLWEGGWTALNLRQFIRVKPDQLETLSFKDSYLLENNPARYHVIVTDSLTYQGQQASLLEYTTKDGLQRLLSFYDVMNTEQPQQNVPWLHPLGEYNVISVEKKSPPTEEVYLFPEFFRNSNTNSPIPEAVQLAVDQLSDMGDYGPSITYRKLDNQWYVLMDEEIYQFVDDQLKSIGKWPIKMSTMIGEGFSGLGAEAFTRFRGHWYIADTQGSRVLRLNDQFQITATLPVPYPYAIEVEKDQLHIASMLQTVITDANLQIEIGKPQPFKEAEGIPQMDYLLQGDEIYTDPKTGLHWYYFHGRLYHYDPNKVQLRSTYVGFNVNARATVRILPFEDELLILKDHRLDRLDRKGHWKGAINFPRSEPDGIYSTTTFGENSYILDQDNGKIYLQQGYRVLELDLMKNVAKTLFRQNYANYGEMVQVGDELYFLLVPLFDPYKTYGNTNEEKYTEMIKLHLANEQPKRYLLEGHYFTLTHVDNDLILGTSPYLDHLQEIKVPLKDLP